MVRFGTQIGTALTLPEAPRIGETRPVPAASDSIEIDLPVPRFFALITDFERYPELVSDIRESRLLARKGSTWDVWFKAHVITDVEYTLRLTGHGHDALTWVLLESPFMSANSGGWKLEELPGERTRATYSVELALNRVVPGPLLRMLVQARLPSMLQEWAKRAREEAARTPPPARPRRRR